MNSTEALMIGTAVLGAVVLLTKGRIGNPIGKSASTAIGGVIAGATEGMIESTLVRPYQWGLNYPDYIPIMDDLAQGLVKFKQFGNNDRWFS